MKWPNATPMTAFLAGASLAGFQGIVDILYSHKLIAFNSDSQEVFPFLALYFFITSFMFVIGLNNFRQRPLTEMILGWPVNREGWKFYFKGGRRMFLWFIGAVAGFIVLSVFEYLLGIL